MAQEQESRRKVLSNEYVFQLSVKLGKGYDANLVNIVGQTQEEFEANLKWATANAAGITSTATALEAAYSVGGLAGNVTATTVTNQQPAQQERVTNTAGGQQGGPVPTCQHGQMKFVAAGTSKAGRAYSAFWSCTGPRATQCSTVDA
jgi:hypothetical protein